MPLSENYETFEKKPLLTPQFYAENLKIISPNQYQSEVQKTAFIMIETPGSYQKKIAGVYVKQENELLFSELLQEAGILTPQERKKEDIKVCQSQQDTKGKTQISCQFTQPGVYKVLLYSYSFGQRQQGIKELGQLKFHAL
ncbi:MAG: hypothetical protein DSM106950_28840 [Stigonema ocellatum SAG 48.90 = DSM 106950]|nr:hypothetical protein [Stigonema ocellatum SAG 48.90 = DSM 106950]